MSELVNFILHCRKCKREVHAAQDQQWAFIRHFAGACLTQLPPNTNPEPPPDWLKEA